MSKEQLIQKLRWLSQMDTYTNAYGVTLNKHPELGAVEYAEECADFLAEYANSIADILETTNG